MRVPRARLRTTSGLMPGDSRITSPHTAEPAVTTGPSRPPQPAAPAGSRLAWLDVLRGVAALAVVFNHFGYFLPPAVKTPVYQWINPGDYGVFVFFLISGYIVPASLERKGSVRTFWVSRLFRLYPLYLLAVEPEQAADPEGPDAALALQRRGHDIPADQEEDEHAVIAGVDPLVDRVLHHRRQEVAEVVEDHGQGGQPAQDVQPGQPAPGRGRARGGRPGQRGCFGLGW